MSPYRPRYRFALYDSAVVPRDVGPDGRMSLFDGVVRSWERRATDDAEAELLRGMVARQNFKMMLSEELELRPGTRWLCGVRQPVVDPSRKPGDVDLLLVHPDAPHQAVAVEVKRTKMRIEKDGTIQRNKVGALGRGVVQVNGLWDRGFFQTYLLIIIVTDAARLEDRPLFGRRAEDEQYQMFYDFPDRDSLRGGVGVIFVDFVQPTPSSADRMAYLGVSIDTPAEPKDQPVELTNRIRELLERR